MFYVYNNRGRLPGLRLKPTVSSGPLTGTLALVGRPNVGKSTLFNRLTRSRIPLWPILPGLTRDRQYGTALLAGRRLVLIDTGGLWGKR